MRRMIKEEQLAQTVNLYTTPSEGQSTFLVQAKITNSLPDISSEGNTVQLNKRKTAFIPGSITKVFQLEVPGKKDAKLYFRCPLSKQDANFDYWADGKGQQVYNKKFSDTLMTKFCTTKTQKTQGLSKDVESTVPNATYSSVQGAGSTMTEGKKVIRLTESDLIKLVKRIINEQEKFPDDVVGVEEFNDGIVILRGADAYSVQWVLERLPNTLSFLSILESEYADLNDVNICDSKIMMVNLRGTPNNFEEVVECEYNNMGKNLYEIL